MMTHQQNNVEKRFILSLIFTLLILVGEVVGGLITHSLALLSDAAHVFMDVFALGLSFLALRLSSRPADDRHTYGWHRLEVLAALINGLTLLVISVTIGWEAYQRFLSPAPVRGPLMLVIAVLGLVVNLVVALVLGSHRHGEKSHIHRDLNLQSAFLHVVGDAVSSVGVIVAAVLIMLTGLEWVDPLASVLIAILILVSSFRVLKSSLHILVEGTPDGLSLAEVEREMLQTPAVASIHDLHVWNLCSQDVALSAHVVLEADHAQSQEQVMQDLRQRLDERFEILHTTLQFEDTACIDKFACNGGASHPVVN
ncbi:cation diffusion facilitator family transporter [Longilinea arvoryzae]|uniref:Cation diffusion facilitator family transporter n=1 Tax=Longilinea arvoryzae TaxID=360412 RepID=A0A0S7BFV7_9CHLR|nr:cation diffusion facilitator family transporter [Longilinea arvoryzae]GAP13904.1 cation diffusion facilitator family transporter [Longilinea arvoryzae]